MRTNVILPLALAALCAFGPFLRAQDEKDGKEDPAASASSGTVERKLKVGNAERTYRLHLPKGKAKEKRVPLVVCLHGAGGTGKIQEGMSGFDEVADENGFAVAYPDGRKRLWLFIDPVDLRREDPEKDEKKEGEKKDEKKEGEKKDDETPKEDEKEHGPQSDVTFLCALLDELVKEGVADPRRIYCTGISNGAYMTNRLALDVPERFAAVAAVAGGIPKQLAERAHAGRAVPFLYFHGTDDPIVGYDGKDAITKRGASLSAEEVVAFWVARDGCGKEAKVDPLPEKAKDGTAVERRSWSGGKDGSEVVFYKIAGGGHTWPGGSYQPRRLLGKASRNVDASRAMWEFFSKHALPEQAGKSEK